MPAKPSRAHRRAPALEPEHIEITGAREHNLRIDRLLVPKKQLVVFTGVSGSGKSSLAFDTLYAEGQRRYVESLSAYARQFLGQMEKPKVDALRGLSPTIAIEQKTASSNPRSTVGTVTEIHDYLRVLYARAGEQRCHQCGRPVAGRSAAEMVDALLAAGSRLGGPAKVTLYAPLLRNRKGEHKELLEDAKKSGFVRARVNGTVYRLEELPPLDKKFKHTIEIVVDRLTIGRDQAARLQDSVETALKATKKGEEKGLLVAEIEGAESLEFSEMRSCPKCGIGFSELVPQSFSFNSPLGMCQPCNGLGTTLEMDPTLVVPDPKLSLREGAIEPWRRAAARDGGWTSNIMKGLSRAYGIDLDMPWGKIPEAKRHVLLHGDEGKRVDIKWAGKHGSGSWAMRWEGIIPQLMRRMRETASESMREVYQKYLRNVHCKACDGARLRPESRAVTVAGKSLVDVSAMTVADAHAHIGALALTGARATIAEELVKEIRARLGFLLSVGLEYLTLDRSAATLSGGEAQRIRLASQLGSELSGVMYVLDEPSIGLHQRDNARLIQTLQRLRDLGNTVLVVEHDEDTLRAADHVVDFGPGAGRQGGEVVFEGPPRELESAPRSITGRYLSGEQAIRTPAERRRPPGFLQLRGARENNLRNLDVDFPLGVLCAVTGVSGAGKSSLIGGILDPALHRLLEYTTIEVGAHDGLTGLEQIDKVIRIDQDPIGRTPRSNPATYTKAFDHIRDLFAQTQEARAFGYKPGRFSFNVAGGRCEACEGDGQKRVEMHFLPDVYVPCEVCRGKRYNEATLRVTYRGKNIAEVLETQITDALGLFENVPPLRRVLETLRDVGLGYVALGQPAPTLSGGEAQRVKLSRELCKRDTGRTLYLLDEPTTGLHFDDVAKLLVVLNRLVDAGNTVLVIEHNLDVIQCADYVIDLGPEGGAKGGEIVATGTPEEVAKVERSFTGRFLRDVLKRHPPLRRARG